jgi:hypothetical protein
VNGYTQYVHHDAEVWVRDDLKGRHKQHCLCHACDQFHPGQEDNCWIAQSLYLTDVEFSIVTPVWECPEFKVKQ